MSKAGNRGEEGERAIAALLLAWYDEHARALPWRTPPGASRDAPRADPYRVWLSEVMLQQTTVPAVIPYFERFTRRWPDVTALARADEGEVMAAWAGLGYYARARNLLACARAVAAAGGAFPDSEEGLRALPGVGAYTAAAVAAIAFGRRAVVVDANVERVVARLFAISEPLPGGKQAIRVAAGGITPEARPGDFAQAMMDLGAGLCAPRSPDCAACPLRARCRGHALGAATAYPVKAAKAPRPERRGRAFWITRERAEGREVWLVTRPARGMLGGMRALPDDGWSARGDGDGRAPLPGDWTLAGEVSHGFTHFTLRLELVVHSSQDARPAQDWARLAAGNGQWWPLARLAEAGLPTLYARAASLMGEAPRNTSAGTGTGETSQ